MKHHSKTNRFEKYPKTVIALILFSVVLLADFVFTGIYHIQKYGTIHKYAERKALREASPVFHHTLKANGQQVDQNWGHLSSPLYTNSLGFKDRKIREIPLAPSNFRFLFIGDSFTEGVGFDYDKTFVGLVDTALANDHIEVLNAAVSSYSPTIYYKKIEYLLEAVGLRFDHLIVFLDISDIEDEAKHYEIRDGRVIGFFSQTSMVKNFVYESTGFLKNIWVFFTKIHTAIFKDPEALRSPEERMFGINRQRSLWTIDDKIFKEYGEKGLKKARHHMDLLYQLLQQHQITMSVAVYPWPDQILHADLSSRQVTYWEEWAKNNSVKFFNFFPSFIFPEIDPKEVIHENFIQGDVHWNERGHEVIARELYAKMRKAFPELLHEK